MARIYNKKAFYLPAVLCFILFISIFACDQKNDQENPPRGEDQIESADMNGIGGDPLEDDNTQICLTMVEFLYSCGNDIPGPFEDINIKDARGLCIENLEDVQCPLTCYKNVGNEGCVIFVSCIASECTD